MAMEIDEYYKQKIYQIEREIESQSEDYMLTVDVNEFANYFYQKNSLPEVREDTSREILYIEDNARKSNYGKLEPYIKVKIPYIHNEHNQQIITNLIANHRYTYIEPYVYEPGYVVFTSKADDNVTNPRIKIIKEEINWKNDNIRQQNSALMPVIKGAIQKRIDNIKNKNDILEKFAKKVNVKLIKKEDSEKNLPPILTMKKSVEVLTRPSPIIPEQPVLSEDEFKGLMDLIDNCCRFFERTPITFSKLGEVDLRNVILSTLNSIYKGNAVGEAFSNIGKTDVYLNISKGKLFVAECKYWSGPKTIADTTEQLLGYLTWRESRGVVIIFSNNKNFSDVLEKAYESIPQVPSYVNGLKSVSKNHFIANHHKRDDKKIILEIQYIIYDLYSSEE